MKHLLRSASGVALLCATLALARTGLRFAPLEPEARIAGRALSAGRGAEMAVYGHRSGDSSSDHGALLLAVDQAMTKRGWDRAVGVAGLPVAAPRPAARGAPVGNRPGPLAPRGRDARPGRRERRTSGAGGKPALRG